MLGNRYVDMVIQDLSDLVTVPGPKDDKRGLLFIEIKIWVYIIDFLDAVLADRWNYFCNYASF
jgi:hypothetical protein